MIYPKTIFRTVIALSTVAATSQATVASPRSSTNGAKRGKGGRYVDTNADFYENAATHGAAYASGALNPQQGASLRKVTSPNTTGGKFSYASPTNSAGVVTLLERSDTTDFFLVQRPRSDKGVGGKRNTGKGGVTADVGGLVSDYVTNGASTVQQSDYSGAHNNYGNNGATGGERSSYGKNQRSGKKSGRSEKGGQHGGASGGAYRPSPGGIYSPVNSPGNMLVPPTPADLTSYGSNTGGSGSQKTGGSGSTVQSNTGSNTGGSGSQKTSQSNGGSKTGGSGSNVQSSKNGSMGGSLSTTTSPVPSSSTSSSSKGYPTSTTSAPVDVAPTAAPTTTPSPQTWAPKPTVTPCTKHKKGKQSRRN